MTWAGLVGFIAATIRSISRPETAVGHAERFLVVTYTAWLVLAALSLAV